ncbi:hypothetical protein MUK42_04654 [Musa troglodytarum]|uniref:DUF7356 domain-containing protein n=1 Tax=Musa troglodytarum TaxID=320322 RepID=A0A9E7GH07_9LILI|nr:hypothetical protein MUK42_35035 [Musa troglodytarum]URE12913.1 hypothetical protein MUK42_04654 [Musa troglodytarum]
MGRIRTFGAILSVLFLLVASVASSRVLLDDDKVSLSAAPNPLASAKSNVSGLSQKPPPKPNNSTDPGGSTYPPPPSNIENKSPQNSTSGEQTKKDDGATGNPSREEDTAKSGSSGSTKEKSMSPTKLEDNYVVKETCGPQSTRCINDKLVACLQRSEHDSNNLSLLVQNIGDDDFSVKIWGTPALHIDHDIGPLSRNSSKKINIPVNYWNATEIVLNAGKGDCVLHIATPVSDWNLFQQFPVYATHLTPIYGTYFLLVIVVLVGGTWVCCRFRKRGKRDDSGIPYQQLEMGAQPQSSSAADSTTVDGWDEWDDDWDEEAVTRPQKHTTGVSSNGLTSRTPKKDGWDADWDD